MYPPSLQHLSLRPHSGPAGLMAPLTWSFLLSHETRDFRKARERGRSIQTQRPSPLDGPPSGAPPPVRRISALNARVGSEDPSPQHRSPLGGPQATAPPA
eukprot:g19923.t1